MATAPVIEADEALPQEQADGDSDRLKEVHRRALRRFDDAVLPQQQQRALSLLARRFVDIPGAQWEGEWGDQFANSIKVQVDKVSQGVDKIVRDYRDNRIVPDFRPAGSTSDQETADTLDGLHRADSYKFKSQQARDNAFEEAVKGGFGAYRLTTEWADPLDPNSDEQRINPGLTIVDADQRVFFDPNSKLYDKSDARFCFVLTADSREAFEDAYPDKASSWPDPLTKLSYDWFTPDVVVKCEYYEVEEKKERLLIFEHRLTREEQRWWGSEIEAEEVAELERRGFVRTERRFPRRRVHKYTLSGAEVLKDHGFIAGDLIPIVPVYGKRAYIDNQERFSGYVHKKMDPQRLYNSNVSKIAEINALAPREKPIFAAQQMPGHLAEQWSRQEIDRHAYALVDPLINPVTGEVLALGPIGKIEPPQLPAIAAALLQISGQDLVEDMQDADEVVANTSAEAMDIAATRIDAKSGIYLDNMRQSVQREGEVYLSMCRDVYWEPGRTVETMSEDGDDGEAVLQEPYTDERGHYGLKNDFTRGRYKVVVDITEATSTRRDKTVKSMLNVANVSIQAEDVEGAQAAIITAVMNMDGEGLEDYRRWNRRRALSLGLAEPNEEEKAEMEQAAQQQQPDATQAVLAAQAVALEAQAEKDVKLAGKAEADTGLAEAKTIETLASAKSKGADAEATRHQMQQPPANDMAPSRPRIRRGSEL